jgi:CheY-like chemotaxis protein
VEETVLVVEIDSPSAQNVQQTLAQAGLKAEISVDAAEAIGLAASHPFCLIVMAVDIPGISGFELFAQIQSLPGHAHTPAIFMTPTENFVVHSNPEVLGESNLLAQPYLPIELLLKAIIAVQRRRLMLA